MDFDNSTETISPDIGSAISIGGDLKVAGRIIRATSTGLVPTGSTQGTAAAKLDTVMAHAVMRSRGQSSRS